MHHRPVAGKRKAPASADGRWCACDSGFQARLRILPQRLQPTYIGGAMSTSNFENQRRGNMALVQCTECGKQISSSAPTCPHCGKTRKKPGGCLELIAGGFLVVLAVILFSHFFGESPSPPPAPAPAPAPQKNDLPAASPSGNPAETTQPATEMLNVPSDTKGRFEVLEVGGTWPNRTIVTRRSGPSGVTYSKRLYDCSGRRVKYLGAGDTLEEMQQSRADSNMAEIVPRSIAYYVGQRACRK